MTNNVAPTIKIGNKYLYPRKLLKGREMRLGILTKDVKRVFNRYAKIGDMRKVKVKDISPKNKLLYRYIETLESVDAPIAIMIAVIFLSTE